MLLPSFYTRSEVWFKRKRWLLGASAPSSYLVVDTAHSPCTPNSHNRESSGILCWQSTVNWASRKDGSIQLHVFLLLVACCCLIGFHLQKTNSMIKLRISEWQQQITKPNTRSCVSPAHEASPPWEERKLEKWEEIRPCNSWSLGSIISPPLGVYSVSHSQILFLLYGKPRHHLNATILVFNPFHLFQYHLFLSIYEDFLSYY